MKRLALLLVLVASSARAQETLPAGWTRVTRVFSGTPTAVACSDDTAFVREWGGTVTAFDGTAGERLPARTESAYGRAIAVDASGHAMIVTQVGVVTFDGSDWIEAPISWPSMRTEINGLFSIDDAHGYFVTDGAIGARDGDHFSLYDVGSWRRLEAISGRSERDLWAVGQGGTVMHFDGTRWSREATNSDAWLRGVALGTSDVWAWSERAILHRDATGWGASAMGSPVGGLHGVVVASRDVFAVGETGVARWSSGTWAPELPASVLGNFASFGAACATDHTLVVVLTSGDVLVRAL